MTKKVTQMNEIKDLKKNDRASLRPNTALKEKIEKDHGSVPKYFDKCVERDYKISKGKIVKRLKK